MYALFSLVHSLQFTFEILFSYTYLYVFATLLLMDNLYKSFYDDYIINNDTNDTFNQELRQIKKESGHQDMNCLSKYFNNEDYASVTDSLPNNYITIICIHPYTHSSHFLLVYLNLLQ